MTDELPGIFEKKKKKMLPSAFVLYTRNRPIVLEPP